MEVGMAAKGGWTLANHIQSTETLDQLKSTTWNYVVLQEQSEIPSVKQFRTQEMYPAARELVHKIKNIGATPIFFITWAHRNGWPENGMNDFGSMQYQINNGYMQIAGELNVPFAPVGPAWYTAVVEHPELNLWQEDGSHPTEQGTYLAACVFYAVIFHESPEGLTYRANLSPETAKTIQAVASTAAVSVR